MKSKKTLITFICALFLTIFACASDTEERVGVLETQSAGMQSRYPVITKEWQTVETIFSQTVIMSHVQWFDGAVYFERQVNYEAQRDDECFTALNGVSVGNKLPVECLPTSQ